MNKKIKFVYDNFFIILLKIAMAYLLLIFMLLLAKKVDIVYLNNVLEHLTSLIVATLLYLSGRFK